MMDSLQNLMKMMEERKIVPNFFCSIPYWQYSKSELKTKNGLSWLETDGICLFPPISENRKAIISPDFIKDIWSDFENCYCNLYSWTREFLDYEYIYGSFNFKDLSGGEWETFRKNIRKWPKKHPDFVYSPEIPRGRQVYLLMAEWLKKHQQTVQDADIIMKFVFAGNKDVHKSSLWNHGKLMAINIWDENYKYINYRLCICDPDEPYLDEFARWLFYTSEEIQKNGKLINDGGTLGNTGLEKFKDKLNPLNKREVYSWKLK